MLMEKFQSNILIFRLCSLNGSVSSGQVRRLSQIFSALRMEMNGTVISFLLLKERKQHILNFNVINAVILGVLNLEHLNFLLRSKKTKMVF